MNYTPHTEQEIKQMLNEIGLTAIDDLFAHIPDGVKLNEPINLPEGISELEVSQKLQAMGNKNLSFAQNPIFMGGGVYDHYIPPAVDALANRSEFYTAYTPYQPEASQGTLQAVIEYQTAIAKLTGMDIANASMYDGSSARAEAI